MPELIPIHDFQKDDPNSTPFRIIALDAGSGYDILQPHRHNYYEVFLFRKGGGLHTIDFQPYQIHDHSVHFISPGQVHLMQRGPESTGVILLFSREFYYCQPGGEELYSFPFLHNSSVPPLLELSPEQFEGFQILVDQLKQEASADTDLIRTYLRLMLLKCRNHFHQKAALQTGRDLELFNNFRLLVEKHYRTLRQPAAYAAQLCITEKKLNLVCKAATGSSAGDFIRDRVLLEAKRLLHNADHSVKEIGYYLGFEDPSYFNRFFKTNTGTTAVGFRNQQMAAQFPERGV